MAADRGDVPRRGDTDAGDGLLMEDEEDEGDHGTLPGDEEDEGREGALPEDEEETGDGSDPEPYPSLHRTRWAIPARRLRVCELLLVLLIAYGPSLISSVWDLSTGEGGNNFPARSLVIATLRQLLELALVAYVLLRRGRSFRDFGLTWRWIDVPAGGLLFVAAVIADLAANMSLNWLGIVATGHPVSFASSPEHLAGVTAIMLNFVYSVVDPIGEEMIVRAFTMTEVEALTGSTALAIAASVGLQTAYHLYQGLPNALVDGAGFLLFACFFARFRRIVPVILAHMCWDLLYLLRHV